MKHLFLALLFMPLSTLAHVDRQYMMEDEFLESSRPTAPRGCIEGCTREACGPFHHDHQWKHKHQSPGVGNCIQAPIGSMWERECKWQDKREKQSSATQRYFHAVEE